VDDMTGRTAVVTGGASGIGRAIVLELAKARMNVVIADIEAVPARAVGAEAEAEGVHALVVPTDVADFASVTALADAAYDEFGAVHVLCNNAGVLVFGKVQDLKIEDWEWLFGVNVFGVLHGIYAFLPRMLAGGEPGHIVNTASIAALSGHGIYGVSKSAILHITETLRDDLEGTPIGVTALCPGMLNTKIVAAQRNRPASMGPKAHEPFGPEPVAFGLDPAHCGRRVRAAILANEQYAFAGIPRGNETALKEGPVSRAQALVDAIDAGVVDEPPL
jgi:NAD(P)-dependent dehydrogenase (short-subunit alcohol dehydrogenase family)